jgi:hypothetical protein
MFYSPSLATDMDATGNWAEESLIERFPMVNEEGKTETKREKGRKKSA